MGFLKQNNLRLAAIEIRKLPLQSQTNKSTKTEMPNYPISYWRSDLLGSRRDAGNFPPKYGAKESEVSNPRSEHMTLFKVDSDPRSCTSCIAESNEAGSCLWSGAPLVVLTKSRGY